MIESGFQSVWLDTDSYMYIAFLNLAQWCHGNRGVKGHCGALSAIYYLTMGNVKVVYKCVYFI